MLYRSEKSKPYSKLSRRPAAANNSAISPSIPHGISVLFLISFCYATSFRYAQFMAFPDRRTEQNDITLCHTVAAVELNDIDDIVVYMAKSRKGNSFIIANES